MYRGVIFDIDGTLVDSNDAHAHAWVQALEEHGRHVAFSRVRPLIGKGSDKLLPELTGISVDSPEGRALVDRRRQIFLRDYVLTLKPTRGAQRLLEWLRDERLTLGIATSAADEEVHALLRVAGATKYFDTKTSSDDVDRSKPDPDIVAAAVERMQCRAVDVVMIGDTPYDVEAALRAGVGIIGLIRRLVHRGAERGAGGVRGSGRPVEPLRRVAVPAAAARLLGARLQGWLRYRDTADKSIPFDSRSAAQRSPTSARRAGTDWIVKFRRSTPSSISFQVSGVDTPA